MGETQQRSRFGWVTDILRNVYVAASGLTFLGFLVWAGSFHFLQASGNLLSPVAILPLVGIGGSLYLPSRAYRIYEERKGNLHFSTKYKKYWLFAIVITCVVLTATMMFKVSLIWGIIAAYSVPTVVIFSYHHNQRQERKLEFENEGLKTSLDSAQQEVEQLKQGLAQAGHLAQEQSGRFQVELQAKQRELDTAHELIAQLQKQLLLAQQPTQQQHRSTPEPPPLLSPPAPPLVTAPAQR